MFPKRILFGKGYPSGKTATYTYDGILRRNSTVINTTAPIQQTYKYMASARGNNVQTTKIEEEILGGNSYKYTYDANGNITSVLLKKSTESAYTKQQQFAYDELNQLIRADDLAKNCTEVYNYDNGGNILSTKVYPLTWGSLSGVTATKTTNYTYGDSNWKDKLTAYGSTQLTYDAIGNPLTYRGFTLTWQNGRQLASMQLMQMRWEFTYDVDGLRTSKKMTNVDLTHNYYYVGSRLQYETISDDTALWYFYDADGNPSGIRYKNGSTTNDYYFVCNWRGDVIQIYNASGVLVGSYDYDAWGNVTEKATSADTQGITETNPIRYRGYYYDTDTRLYYVNSRYYDPAVKRFVNSDDSSIVLDDQGKISQYNLFAYCFNNPANMEDKDGEAAANIIGGIVGGVAGAALGVLLAKRLGLTGWKKWALISAATVGGAALGAFLGPYVARLAKSMGAAAKSLFKQTVKYKKITENANKVHHFFGKSQHKLGGLLRKFGGNERKAYNAIYNATFNQVKKRGITGRFEIVVKVSGKYVTVRGNVVNGIVRMGTGFIK